MLRKLKTLKKQKMDESKLRSQAESKLQAMRKDKGKLEAELELKSSALEQAEKLVATLKSLHETCTTAEAIFCTPRPRIVEGDPPPGEAPILDRYRWPIATRGDPS